MGERRELSKPSHENEPTNRRWQSSLNPTAPPTVNRVPAATLTFQQRRLRSPDVVG